MRRILVKIFGLATLMLIGFTGAQHPGMGKGMGGGHEGMHGMMGMMADSCAMGGMYMHSMMGATMVPTEDGGVVVMVANQLYKYDRNLVLKKEAEIKIDTAKLRGAMMGMSRACHMRMGAPADTSADRSVNPSGSVSPDPARVLPIKATPRGKSAAPQR